MRKLLLISLTLILSSTCVFSFAEGQPQTALDSCSSDRIGSYLDFLDAHLDVLGPLGDSELGEIEIVTDASLIPCIEADYARKLIESGESPEEALQNAQAGVFINDAYFLYLRDPVRFPSGATGLYSRLLWKRSLFTKNGTPGVTLLPVQPDGKIVLNVAFRHSTRSWEIELPGGLLEPGEDASVAAKRELEEETGFTMDGDLHYLGSITTDDGVLGVIIPLYMGKITGNIAPNPEETEALAGPISLSIDEINEALLVGYKDIPYKGSTIRAKLRDPYLTYSLYLANLKKLI